MYIQAIALLSFSIVVLVVSIVYANFSNGYYAFLEEPVEESTELPIENPENRNQELQERIAVIHARINYLESHILELAEHTQVVIVDIDTGEVHNLSDYFEENYAEYQEFYEETKNKIELIDSTEIEEIIDSIEYEKEYETEVYQETQYNIHNMATWETAANLFPRYSNATIIDVATGRSFRIQRTFGSNHADIETLTTDDSQIVYEIWGGHSWVQRAVVVITDDGHVMPASMNGYPHAGLDHLPPLQVVDNRSGGFGRGQNLNLIRGNGIDGHFCLHFVGSTTHGTRRVHAGHQAQIAIAQEFINNNF